MTDLEQLAERCERANEPDRGLDAWILGKTDSRPWSDEDCKYAAEDAERTCGAPWFTSSLDAAMQLVPERSWIRLDEWPSDFCMPVASVTPIIEESGNPTYTATGSSLALALCAAALRARSAK